jgi:hypothetical protein
MVELTRTLERERDEWRKKAVDLNARHKGALEDIEAEITARDEARRIAKEACELLDREGYQVNYPPMPWEPDSPEYVEPYSSANSLIEPRAAFPGDEQHAPDAPANAAPELLKRCQDLEQERDRLRVLAGELIAVIRINVMQGSFTDVATEDLDGFLAPFVERLNPNPNQPKP